MKVEPRAWDQRPFRLARTQREVSPLRPGAQARCQPDLGRVASRDVEKSVLSVSHPDDGVLSQPPVQTPPTRRPCTAVAPAAPSRGRCRWVRG